MLFLVILWFKRHSLRPLLFLHPLTGGCGTRLSIRRQDPNNYSDTEARCLVYSVLDTERFLIQSYQLNNVHIVQCCVCTFTRLTPPTGWPKQPKLWLVTREHSFHWGRKEDNSDQFSFQDFWHLLIEVLFNYFDLKEDSVKQSSRGWKLFLADLHSRL